MNKLFWFQKISICPHFSLFQQSREFNIRNKLSFSTRKAAMSEFKITEISGDLFSAGENISLAHSVGADLTMKAGIAVMFKRKFEGVPELLKQEVKTGGVAVLKKDSRFIYYLVTKKHSLHKPTYPNLALSLAAMRDHMRENNVKKVAMPRIGCGIDDMEWPNVVNELNTVFGQEKDVEIIVYNFVPK